jgi:hypothetical protein
VTAVDRRRQSAALWGVVGALSFLVLYGAYLLAGGRGVALVGAGGVALAVGVLVTLAAYALEPRVARRL